MIRPGNSDTHIRPDFHILAWPDRFVCAQDFAVETMIRILNTTTLKKDVLTQIETTLKEDFMHEISSQEGTSENPHQLLAHIFNNFDRKSEENYMKALTEKIPDDAERIQSYMFTFDDLAKLDNRSMQKIIAELDSNLLLLATKSAKDDLKELIFNNMSERAKKLLEEDLASMGGVRVKEIDEARSAVVKLAKQLEADGAIVLPSNDPDQVLV